MDCHAALRCGEHIHSVPSFFGAQSAVQIWFRDWAEDLVVNKIDEAYQVQAQVQQLSLFPEPVKRNHNRLTKDRLVDILADVAKIDDKSIRLSLIDKLTNIKA